MNERADMIEYLATLGYELHAAHADCRRNRSLQTLGTYCLDHEVKVLPK